MELKIPLFTDLSMQFTPASSNGDKFPTAQLQKGLVLVHAGQELAEEGVGFGVPVLKQGLQTIFPGAVELASLHKGATQEISAVYKLCLEERIAGPGDVSIENKLLYTAKNTLAALIRRFPASRNLLTAASNKLRRMFGWKTIYEETGFSTTVKLLYTIYSETGDVDIQIDMTGLPKERITEVIVMNEQGAHHFDLYRDSGGTHLQGKEIGCWDEVTAGEASFISKAHQVVFTLGQVKGAKLFRGRELIDPRLAWAGFGYSFPPEIEKFEYRLKISRSA